jgi:N-acetyl-gamma-glutamyl-phosphate reductase
MREEGQSVRKIESEFLLISHKALDFEEIRMEKKIKVGIVGGTGYTGIELLRLLSQHPQAELVTITGRRDAGTAVCDMYPSLRGIVDLTFVEPDKAPLKECDVVFFATPHGVAMSMARELLAAGVKIIDLAADFRLKDPALFQKWYKMEHTCPDILKEAVYGQPETQREKMRGARVIGLAGCYPTSIQLGLLPLLELQKKEGGILDFSCPVIADSKSGISGSGKKADVSIICAEASDNFKAYGAKGHRHEPEIIQQLSELAGETVPFIFQPHLLPTIRGIFSTIYVRLTDKGAALDVQKLYEDRYRDEYFVDVMPAGSLPETRMVRGSNFARIALYKHGENMLKIFVVEDNLVKGAAGQAVQTMNLLCGLPENTGLKHVALVP